MDLQLYILDLIGTTAFAMYGSYFAIHKKFDLFGITLSALLTAVGGGTIRSILLNELPIFFFDPLYIAALAIGILISLLIYKQFARFKKLALFVDSIGLVTFAFIASSIAIDAQFGIFGVALLAMITAVGGGIMRDLILNEVPLIMRSGIYASIAIFVGVVYALFPEQMQNVIWANFLMLAALSIRLLAIWKEINLWKPNK